MGAAMPIISLAATVASAAVGAFGAIQSANAQSAAANYQAQVARVNQQIQQQNAAYERQKGDVEAQQQDQKNKAEMGMLAAAQGASGFDMNMGSSLDTRESQARINRLNTLTTRNNAERRAHEFDVAAMNQGAQAGLYGMQAKTAKSAGYVSAMGSLIGGAGAFADKWMKFSSAGLLAG